MYYRIFLFIIALLTLTLPQQLYAKTDRIDHSAHGNDHDKIFHAFTIEADAGYTDKSKSATSFDAEGWVGNDFNRLWLRSEQKRYGNYDGRSQLEALYSHNISQFWDAQAGIRHDFSTDFSNRNLNYLTVGFEGLASYFFETTAQLYLSDWGKVSGEFRQKIDLLITQKLIAEPYLEAEFSASDVNKLGVKSGLSELELGVITRYEVNRKFAPYAAIRYNSKMFATRKFAKEQGGGLDAVIASLGLRIKF